MCLCVHVRSRVYAGNTRSPTLTPAKPREGAAVVAAAAAGRPSSLPAPPPPRPLPAGRFADRPNRQKLRVRGPLGAFLLWCELPMAGAGAGAGTQAQPNQPGHRAAAPGHRQRDSWAATAGAPSPSSATPPGSAANGWARDGAGGGVGPGACPLGSAPPGPGRPAEPPCPERSGKGRASPGEAGR